MRAVGEGRWLATYRTEGAEGIVLGTGHVICRYGASTEISVWGVRLPAQVAKSAETEATGFCRELHAG